MGIFSPTNYVHIIGMLVGVAVMVVRRKDSPEERRQAFEKEALPHMGAMYALAMRLTRRPQDAEDLVQDAYLRAYRFFEQWEPDTNLRAWLFTILRNAFINRYRRKVSSPLSVDFEKIEETYESLIAETVRRRRRDPEQALLDGTLDGEIREALDRLPEEYREVVWMAVVEDMAYKEIARVLSIPIGTVMSRLHRGRRLLQTWLLDYGRRRGLVKEQKGQVAQPIQRLAKPEAAGESET